MQGKLVRFVSAKEVVLQSYTLPSMAPHEILVKTRYSMISPGTERANLLAEVNTDAATLGFPFRPGYSNVGQVIRVGASVRNVKEGQFVATMAGHQSHVIVHPPPESPRTAIGLADALFAANVADASWSLPDDLDDNNKKCCAAFAIVMVGLYGLRRSQIAIGDQVLVLGLGPVGLAAGQFAKLSGALPVIGVARTAELRRLACEVGFDMVFSSLEELQKTFPAYVNSVGTIVIEATGRPDGVLSAFEACPEGAQLVLLGSTRGLVAQLDFYSQIHRKALIVIGAHQPTRPSPDPAHRRWLQYWDADTALRMILSKRILTESLITSEFSIHDVEAAYRTLRDTRGSLCIALRWDD